MKTAVISIAKNERIGEVDTVVELIRLLKELRLTPADIWFSLPNDTLWDELIENWKYKAIAMNDNDLLSTVDGLIWSKRFLEAVKRNPEVLTEDGVNAWFCNAIMTGYDRGVKEQEAQKNLAYSERNKLLSAYAKLAHACGLTVGIGLHEDKPGEDWEADWKHIIFIDLPTGQVSFHVHDSELKYFEELPRYQEKYDGHTTEEKWSRIMNFNPDWGFWNA